MSAQDNNKPNSSYNKRRFQHGRYYNAYYHTQPPYFNYSNPSYSYQQSWGYRRKRPPSQRLSYKTLEKKRARSPSPFSGTEEYNLKKIQETSDMIKRRLMMPENDDMVNLPKAPPVIDKEQTVVEKAINKTESEKITGKVNKKVPQYNVGEIHQRIIGHITNLSHGKKMNLICSNSSGYDVAIQQIQKQKRLELSKALRDMCSNQTAENTEAVNAIIPDIGIKIEDLPLDVIQQLSSTLNMSFEEISTIPSSQLKEESTNETDGRCLNIKSEVLEVQDDDNSICDNQSKNCNIKQDLESELKVDVSLTDNQKYCNAIFIKEIKQEKVEENDMSSYHIKQEVLDIEAESKIEDGADYLNYYENKTNIVNQTSRQTCSVSSQTENKMLNSISTQTDPEEPTPEDKFCLHKGNINNLGDAVEAMLEIDKEIMRLTKLRQSIFTRMQKGENKISDMKNKIEKKQGGSTNLQKKQKKSKAKIKQNNQKKKGSNNTEKNAKGNHSITRVEKSIESSYDDNKIKDLVININSDFDTPVKEEESYYDSVLDFGTIPEKVLVMKVIEDTLVVATEGGKIFYIDTTNGTTLSTVKVTNAPIISICHYTTKKKHSRLLIGSSDTKMHEFDYATQKLVKTTNLNHQVQCIELAWSFAFIGTTTGNLIRYSVKCSAVQFSEQISSSSIMVLKATLEGSRRVLLIGMRNAPVYVRDAMSGLHLRTMNELITPTVFCLLLEKSMVYCGTMSHDILVYSFHNGNLVHKHQAANSKGICCMKVVDNLLFTSCYNGNIYVYNVKTHTFVGLIEGPGGAILSMEIIKNLVIVGTMSHHFKSILIPDYMLI